MTENLLIPVGILAVSVMIIFMMFEIKEAGEQREKEAQAHTTRLEECFAQKVEPGWCLANVK